MKQWAWLALVLTLAACSNAAGSLYGGSSGGGGGGSSDSSSGPPWHVTYKNTTVNTTGTVPTDATAYADGDMVTVLGDTGNLSWPPFHWVAWNTKDNGGELGGGGGDDYAPGAMFKITSNMTLYGRWVHD